MTGAEIVKGLITASVLLLVFALGLRATFADASSLFRGLFRPPHRLLRALLAMYVVVPACAVGLSRAFGLPGAVSAAMLAMAVAPIPPILPGKQLKAGGSRDYVFGLLVAVSVCAVVLVPIAVPLLGRIVGHEASFGPLMAARLIATSILVPLALGMTVRHFAAGPAMRIAPWASRIGTILLVAGVVPVLIDAWPELRSIAGQGTMLAMLALVGVAMAAGHALGGPDPDDRSTLAFATAMRHPGVGLAIARLNVPEEPLLGAAVLLYLLAAVVATTAYALVLKRRRAP